VYEVGLSQTFSARHVMPGAEGPEGELHSHDYQIEVVASRPELDRWGMVVDLDALGEALSETVAQVEGEDLEVIRPEGTEAVTVEVLAGWAHAQLAGRLGPVGGHLAVRVWESPIAFGGYSAPLLRA
jgi:6-pyruvoyltetrahydropterin/6-carboxytetrahydropterin synthase